MANGPFGGGHSADLGEPPLFGQGGGTITPIQVTWGGFGHPIWPNRSGSTWE